MNPLLAWARTIKLSHSVFALPFALASAQLASRSTPIGWGRWVLIVLAVVTARASAMSMNRLVDRRYDALNPRTAGREIPAGLLGVGAARGLTALSAVAFVGVAWALGPLVGRLSPIALAVVWGYSWTKRFTSWCHVVLGLALALAPTGAWLAVQGSYGATPLLISLAVATWVAGFDILYATQDLDFDRATGLHSVPARLGVVGALRLSAGLHVLTVLFLGALPWTVPLGWPYSVGWVGIALVLAYEHHIVRPTDLTRIDKAFFDLNGVVSLGFFVAVWCA